MDTASNFIQDGGFVMYPLLFCSVLSWAIFIERVFFFYQFRRELKELFLKGSLLIEEGKKEEAKGLGHSLHPSLAIPYRTIFIKKGEESKLEQALGESEVQLGRLLWALGTIGSSSPFLGLFGTVVGIIKAFQSIADSGGKAGFSIVASGLSEALIATAAGILVAVVAIIFYNYLQVRLRRINLELQNRMEDMDQLYRSKQ